MHFLICTFSALDALSEEQVFALYALALLHEVPANNARQPNRGFVVSGNSRIAEGSYRRAGERARSSSELSVHRSEAPHVYVFHRRRLKTHTNQVHTMTFESRGGTAHWQDGVQYRYGRLAATA